MLIEPDSSYVPVLCHKYVQELQLVCTLGGSGSTFCPILQYFIQVLSPKLTSVILHLPAAHFGLSFVSPQ